MDFCEENSKTASELSLEMASKGLGNLGRNAERSHFVYRDLLLSNKNLDDISILSSFIHIMKLDLSHNNLREISSIDEMSSLIDLDVSHNQLDNLLECCTPKVHLIKANLSHNRICRLPDLTPYASLECLDIKGNSIAEIRGLNQLKFLKNLDLSSNNIRIIEGLDCLPLRSLNLSNNYIDTIENLENLYVLNHLDLSNNRIKSLSGLESLIELSTLNLEINEIMDLSELHKLRPLEKLQFVNLKENPVKDLLNFRALVVFLLPSLVALNEEDVTLKEKVDTEYLFNPPIEYRAARDHVTNNVFHFFQHQRLLDSTLSDPKNSYPFLVLVGPEGQGKTAMGVKLSFDFPDRIGFVPCHAARHARSGEVDGRDYCFVQPEEFEDMIHQGSFLATYTHNETMFGFSRQSFESVAPEGRACVAQMELEGALSLSLSYFKPFYILILPCDDNSYERRLLEKDDIESWQVEANLRRLEMYQDYQRRNPCFFHASIVGDDLLDVYVNLKQLVSDYLDGKQNTNSKNSNVEVDKLEHVNEDLKERIETVEIGQNARAEVSGSDSKDNQTSLAPENSKTDFTPPRVMNMGLMEQLSWQRRHAEAYKAVSNYTTPLYDKVVESFTKTLQPKVTPDDIYRYDDDDDDSDEERSSGKTHTPLLKRNFSVSSASVRNWKTNYAVSSDRATKMDHCHVTPIQKIFDKNEVSNENFKAFRSISSLSESGKNHKSKTKLRLPAIKT